MSDELAATQAHERELAASQQAFLLELAKAGCASFEVSASQVLARCTPAAAVLRPGPEADPCTGAALRALRLSGTHFSALESVAIYEWLEQRIVKETSPADDVAVIPARSLFVDQASKVDIDMDGSFSATELKNGLELYLSRGALHEAGLSFFEVGEWIAPRGCA